MNSIFMNDQRFVPLAYSACIAARKVRAWMPLWFSGAIYADNSHGRQLGSFGILCWLRSVIFALEARRFQPPLAVLVLPPYALPA